MYQKRFLVGKIEYYYPSGMLSDVNAVTNSQHKAIEYVLKKLMIIQLINDFGDKHGLGVTDFYADYHIADLNTGKTYKFNYGYNLKLGTHLEELIKKYESNEDIQYFCNKLEKECQEQLAEEDSWKELFIESYIDLNLDISLEEQDTENVLETLASLNRSQEIEVL